MFNNVRRIFLFDENSLNSSSSDTASTSSTRITNTTDPSTSTIHDSSVDSGISSPLDQFEIIPLIPMHLGDFYFSFTNPSLFMLLSLSSVPNFFHSTLY